MNIVTTTSRIFLLLFVLGRSEAHLNIANLVQQKCDNEHSFVTSIVWVTDKVATIACTGSLITLQWVITTGACFYKLLRKTGTLRSYPNITIRAAFDSKHGTFEEKELSRFIPYDKKAGMRSETTDDPLLIQLKEPFEPSSKLSVIKPATKSQVDSCEMAETVSPVSVTEESESRGLLTKLLKKTVVKACRGITFVKNSDCSRLWPWLKSRLTLCGEMNYPSRWRKKSKREDDSDDDEDESLDVSTCEGAEGSPLVCGNALIAVQSRCKQSSARSNTAQSSFVRLDPYLDFIANAIGDKSLKRQGGWKADKGDNENPLKKFINKKKRKAKKMSENKIEKAISSFASSGAELVDGASWKMAAKIGTVLFIYFL